MHRSQRLALRILGLVCMLGVSGIGALQCTTTNSRNNTATGRGALSSNTTGVANTATGVAALVANTTGSWNTACGAGALGDNTTGKGNIVVGAKAGGGLGSGDKSSTCKV